MTAADLRRQIERVAAANEKIDDFRILAGSEVNVMPDGSLDYDDELLAELDWIVASAHTSFRMSEDEMTARIVTAIEHPLVDAIGHPTGRLIGRREPYALDVDAVIAAAARTGTFLEINANPNRRDLNDVYARAAVKAGVKIVIDSDAHGVETLANMRFGLATARRGLADRRRRGQHPLVGRPAGAAPARLSHAGLGSILRAQGVRTSSGAPKAELRSTKKRTPSRSSIACTAEDCLRQVSATPMA